MTAVDDFIKEKRIKQALKHINIYYDSILDVGCGDCEIVKYLNTDEDSVLYTPYTGIDLEISENTLLCIKGDVETINVKGKYDVILMLAVIEHLKQPLETLKKLKKNLKKDGRIIITTPTPFADKILKIMFKLNMFDKKYHYEEHNVLFNWNKINRLAYSLKMEIIKYKTFEFGLNQLVILKNEN